MVTYYLQATTIPPAITEKGSKTVGIGLIKAVVQIEDSNFTARKNRYQPQTRVRQSTCTCPFQTTLKLLAFLGPTPKARQLIYQPPLYTTAAKKSPMNGVCIDCMVTQTTIRKYLLPLTSFSIAIRISSLWPAVFVSSVINTPPVGDQRETRQDTISCRRGCRSIVVIISTTQEEVKFPPRIVFQILSNSQSLSR